MNKDKRRARNCNRFTVPPLGGKLAGRSFFWHPGLAQALDYPVPKVENAPIGVRIGDLSLARLLRRDRLEGGDRKRKGTLERFARLRVTTGQSKCRNEGSTRKRLIWIVRDRLAGPLDRLIVLLQSKIGVRFPDIPRSQRWIARTEPNCLVIKFETLFKLPEAKVCVAHVLIGEHGARVQGKRQLVLRDGFVEAPLDIEYKSLKDVSGGIIWIKGERLRHQFVRPLEVGLGIGTAADRNRHPELYG